MNLDLVAIVGPTACGKTRRAVELANRLDSEIISADSRQVYKGMDIGTGKDMSEYGSVPVHLVDVAPAGYKYNLYEYLRDASAAIDDIKSRGKLPVLCGGTGLYVESVLKGLRLPEVPKNEELRQNLACKTLDELTRILSGMKRLHNSTDVDTCQRAIRAIEIEKYYAEHPDEARLAKDGCRRKAAVIGLDIDRDSRRERISYRLRHRLEQENMVEEVEQLLSQGIPAEDLIYYGLEYKYLTLYVTGQTDYTTMVKELEIAIHQFAKRQMTWFRGMERRGFHIHWLPYDLETQEFIDRAEKIIGL